LLRDVKNDPRGLYWLRYFFLTNAYIPAPDNFWANLANTWTVCLFWAFYLLSVLLVPAGRTVYRSAMLYAGCLLLKSVWVKAGLSDWMAVFYYIHFFILGIFICRIEQSRQQRCEQSRKQSFVQLGHLSLEQSRHNSLAKENQGKIQQASRKKAKWSEFEGRNAIMISAFTYILVIAACAAMLYGLDRSFDHFTVVSWLMGLILVFTLPFGQKNSVRLQQSHTAIEQGLTSIEQSHTAIEQGLTSIEQSHTAIEQSLTGTYQKLIEQHQSYAEMHQSLTGTQLSEQNNSIVANTDKCVANTTDKCVANTTDKCVANTTDKRVASTDKHVKNRGILARISKCIAVLDTYSYDIYLTHGVVMEGLVLLKAHVNLSASIILILMTGLTAVSSYAAQHLIDQPARRLSERLRRN